MRIKKFFNSGSKITRLLYGSDFHGSETVFRKFLSAAFVYDASTLIVGGDVTGKAMVPIIHQGKGKYLGYIFGRKEESSTPDELEKMKSTIRNVGFYPIVLEPDEAEALEKDAGLMSCIFEREMCQRVREWMALAEEKLVPYHKQLFFMPGNDDLYSIDQVLLEFEHVKNPDMNRFLIEGDYELYGNSNANMTPWACARDLEEDDLQKKMDELASLVQNPERSIMVLHVPPIDSGLDTCPDLDENLTIITKGGHVVMKAAGATAVRKLLEKVQPLLSLHGHIHESPGHTRLGRTLAINAGSEYAEGIMKAAIINLEGGSVKGHMLISA